MDDEYYQDNDDALWGHREGDDESHAFTPAQVEAYLRARQDTLVRKADPAWIVDESGGAHPPPAEQRERGGLTRQEAQKQTYAPLYGTTDNNPKAARALLDGKAPMEQLILSIFAGAARVMRTGAAKYGTRNWRREPISASTYEGALLRHFSEWQDGHDVDKDSGEHPFSHMIATCMIVLDAIEQGTFVDDRDRTEIVNKENENE